MTLSFIAVGPAESLVGILPAIALFSFCITGVLMLCLSRWLARPEMRDADSAEMLRSAEDRIRKLAYFDSVTNLPNRTYFIDKLEETIRQNHGRLALITIDIDSFKDINDSLGHEAGDKLLTAVGKRIVRALPQGSVVSRSSADEFAAIVHLGPAHPDSSAVVEKVFAAMLEPVQIMKERLQVRVSIGVAHCPDDGQDARQIMKNADIALNRAKEEGRDTVRYYSQDFDRAIQHRFQMLRDLRIAIEQKQLRLYYQPQIDLKTGELLGAEALLRWYQPDASGQGGKYISPVEFVPLAEESGLIVPIGEYALRTACESSRKWQQAGMKPLRIAVNISGVQFHRSDVVGLVDTVLAETGLEAHLLELEITESIFMENIQLAIDTLNRLHDLGVELAIDDFGTGYSSLSYLRQFPVDRLKIDQSFIRNALSNRDDQMIIRTIISLGHNLGLKVVAEGVETDEHVTFLKAEGCDEAQGYRYAKPLPEDEFIAFAQNFKK